MRAVSHSALSSRGKRKILWKERVHCLVRRKVGQRKQSLRANTCVSISSLKVDQFSRAGMAIDIN